MVPSPSPITTDGWQTYTSDRYGFDIRYPADWANLRQAVRDWTLDTDGGDWSDEKNAAESFHGTWRNQTTLVTAFAATLPVRGETVKDWLALYDPLVHDQCPSASTAELRPITIAGRTGLTRDTCTDSQAFVIVGERIYVFSVWRPRDRDLLDAFVSTVQFHG